MIYNNYGFYYYYQRESWYDMNHKMNILKALGIIAVVAGHAGTNFLSWVPVYSFHMPLFIFISGYFFHEYNFFAWFKKRFRHMLVPFLGWNAFYGIVVTLLLWSGLTALGSPISLRGLLWDPFTYCWAYVFNGPSWFIGTLFLVQAVYLLIRKYISHDWGLLLITLGCYIGAIWLANNGYSHWENNAGIAVERMMFCLIFYHVGYLYRHRWEQYDGFSFTKIMGVIFVNGCILAFVTPNIMTNIHQMAVQDKPVFVPLIVACTGIWLYLQVADILQDKVSPTSVLSYIGQHTFSVMIHHQFFFWLFNTFLLFLKTMHVLSLNTFNYHQYMTNEYFRITAYGPINDALYLLVGLFGPLLCCYVWDTVRRRS